MPNQDPRSVSVIVPTLNVASTIQECLGSLVRQAYPGTLTEIIVVDGESSDDTVQRAEQFPVKILVVPGNAPKAMNRGAQMASGNFLLFADGDAYYPPTWIQTHVDMLSIPDEVASGGPCLSWNRGGILSLLIGFELEARYLRLPDRVSRIATMNLGVRRDVFHQVGGFAEALDVAYDTDFGYRLTESGYKIRVSKKAEAFHANRDSLGRYMRQQCRYGRFVPILIRKHPSAMVGDPVTGFWMYVQPLLLGLFLVSSSIGIIVPASLPVAGALAGLLGVLLLEGAVRAVVVTLNWRAILTPIVLIVRLYAWMFGGLQFLFGLAPHRSRTRTG